MNFCALDNKMTEGLEALNFIISQLVAPLQAVFPILNKLPLEVNRKLDRSFNKLEQIIFDIIEKAKEKKNIEGEYYNVVDHIVAIAGDTLSKKSIRDNMLLFYFAGYETTASVITSTLYFLAKYPDLQKKSTR